MYLNEAIKETTYRIINLHGQSELNRHLNNLGFHVGEEVYVVSKTSGNYIVKVKETRYGIESRVAKVIEVERI